jgi:phage terminase large subunit GpA-like protein
MTIETELPFDWAITQKEAILAARLAAIPREASHLVAGWATAAAPPPAQTVSQWAEEQRVLPESSGARGGRWRNAAAPYLVGIMDAVHEPGVKTIAVEKGAQLGGSEVLNNILGYFIEYDPCPILYVLPTFGDVEEWSKQRLADMIRQTPALRAVVRDKRQPRGSHEAESTLNLKIFPGGFLALGGANTPNTFARRAVRIAIGDDVDRFPPVVGDEGDPADLLEKRTTTFHDALVLMVSTPTLKGGRIDSLYERSDQRRYLVACPHCGREDWITWNDPTHFRVTFEEKDPATARLACPDEEHGGCGALMTEPERRQMIAAAAARPDHGWRPTAEPQQVGLVGFRVPALISTLGVSLESLVGEWLASRVKGKESLKVFVNTRLGEGWEERGTRMSHGPLYGRREEYGDGVEVPAAAVALTAGVDVQENRFELLVTAWGPAEERWVVDLRQIPGRPEKDAEVWTALREALERRYAHASGHQLPIHSTCIDSGYATEKVYDFVLAHQVRRIYATKGIAGRSGEPVLGKPTEKRYGKSPRPVRLWPVNVDDAKTDVMASLALASPGPGFIHFPTSLEEEFFAQLCAEHRETRYNKSGVATHFVWMLDRERNEGLDLTVLCLAAYRLLRPNILQMAGALAAIPVGSSQPTPPTDTAAAQKPAAASSAPVGRRVSHSSYLGR